MFEKLTSREKASNGPYQYAPICANREIRLFTFLKGRDSKAIYVRIEHHVLDSNIPSFECISYMWHGPQRDCIAETGSGRIDITRNLYNALRRFQADAKYNKKRFWADQICINQAGQERSHEKSEQVSLMWKIFPQATRVICWLGEKDDQTKEAFQLLRDWSAASRNKKLRDRLARQLKDDVLRRGRSGPPGPLATFFSRPWFGRIWMLQEVYVPRDRPPLVVCGSFEIRWEELVSAFKTLNATFSGTLAAEALGQDFRHAMAMFVLYENHSTTRVKLSALLQHAMTRQATDKRDLVYGLLGIAQQQGYQYPKPDYHERVTVHHVFEEYTRAIIEQERSLDVLNYNKHGLGETASWIFDPNLISRNRTLLLDPKQKEVLRGFGAAGQTKPIVINSGRRHDTNLILAGLPVDQLHQVVDLELFIRELGKPGVRWTMIRDITMRLTRTLKISSSNPHANEQLVTEILRTLLANDFWVGFPQQATTYDNEGETLYHSFHQSGLVSVVDVRSWTGEKLVKLAQQSFPLDRRHITTAIGLARHENHNLSTEEATMAAWMEGPVMETFVRRIESNAGDRKLAVTRNGMLALVPHTSRCGDDVAVLLGGFYPFVLRKVDPSGRYWLVGPGYVKTLMDGRAVQEYEARHRQRPRADIEQGSTRFCLV